ncbi:MAG: IclR family transcriptional regulator [Chloroflexota bacterium]
MRDNTVQSVVRAIDILNFIAKHPSGVGVTAVADALSLHKSTVSRLVSTLEKSGAISRTNNRADVQISPNFINTLVNLSQQEQLILLAQPFLQTLSKAAGEDSGLAVPERDQAHYIHQVSVDRVIQVRDWTGYRFPLHTVSAGKLFLAYRTPAEQKRYISQPLAAYTENTLTQPDALHRSLQEVKASGVSWIFDEFSEGLNAVAAPIFDAKHELVAALCLYAPSFRFPKPGKHDEIISLIKQKADEFSQLLSKRNVVVSTNW